MPVPAAEKPPIPTNIITGFLGVGKTSAILHLLAHKPAGERWAVLVNEFGEIGIDGSLFQGSHREKSGVFIREVPGGCMCCTAGVSMQIALRELLTRACPDRLLIEPTGLGHPVEVLQTLAADRFSGELAVQKTLTLVDARVLAGARVTENPTFNQQIAIADVVIGNKQDLCSEHDLDRLKSYVSQYAAPDTRVFFTRYGALDPEWLEGPTAAVVEPRDYSTTDSATVDSLVDQEIPECGYVSSTNTGEGFESIGWRFSPYRVFDYDRLLEFLTGLRVERMKAVFITGNGVFAYNMTPDALSEVELDDCMDSRMEIIAARIDDGWEERLLQCIETSA